MIRLKQPKDNSISLGMPLQVLMPVARRTPLPHGSCIGKHGVSKASCCILLSAAGVQRGRHVSTPGGITYHDAGCRNWPHIGTELACVLQQLRALCNRAAEAGQLHPDARPCPGLAHGGRQLHTAHRRLQSLWARFPGLQPVPPLMIVQYYPMAPLACALCICTGEGSSELTSVYTFTKM